MTHRLSVAGLLLLGMLGTALAVGWAEPEIAVKLNPEKKLKVGQTAELLIQLSWPSEEADYHFTQPQPVLELLNLEEIGESNEVLQREGRNWRQKSFRLRLKASNPGTGRITLSRLSYIDPTRQLGGQFEVSDFEFKISPDHSRLYQALAISLLTLILGGVVVCGSWLFLHRNAKSRASEFQATPNLEEQYVSKLWEQKESGDVVEAEKLLRHYLVDKYELPSRGGATSREVVDQLRPKIGLEDWNLLKKLFSQLEEYRYAARTGSSAEGSRLYNELIRFVEGKKVVTQQNT